jgi:hypothetical protein
MSIITLSHQIYNSIKNEGVILTLGGSIILHREMIVKITFRYTDQDLLLHQFECPISQTIHEHMNKPGYNFCSKTEN